MMRRTVGWLPSLSLGVALAGVMLAVALESAVPAMVGLAMVVVLSIVAEASR